MRPTTIWQTNSSWSCCVYVCSQVCLICIAVQVGCVQPWGSSGSGEFLKTAKPGQGPSARQLGHRSKIPPGCGQAVVEQPFSVRTRSHRGARLKSRHSVATFLLKPWSACKAYKTALPSQDPRRTKEILCDSLDLPESVFLLSSQPSPSAFFASLGPFSDNNHNEIDLCAWLSETKVAAG